MALSFYACGNYQRKEGRSADIAVSQKSASRFIREITEALNHPEVLGRFIHFPVTQEERAVVIRRNEQLGMPRVLGFIDGTLISIVPPPHGMERQSYYCRKGFTAINAQIVSNIMYKVKIIFSLYCPLKLQGWDHGFPTFCNLASFKIFVCNISSRFVMQIFKS